ncbi:MAG: DUF3489 domain-containing protein [Nitrospirae bacterium]|nr:DUF3489 domain-containing protein [Magnetococcales bacterium]
MNDLTKTQETIIVAATTREDGSIYPMPPHIKGGAINKVLASLRAKGLIDNEDKIAMHVLMVIDPDFKSARGQHMTRVESSQIAKEDAEAFASQQGMVWDWPGQANEPQTTTAMETDEVPNATIDFEDEVKAAEQSFTKPKKVRDDTKKAKVIEMMKRPEGATAAQIAEMTGWQGHTIRGFLSIAKSKMGLVITTQRLRMVGPNQQGSPGSFTTYFAQ